MTSHINVDYPSAAVLPTPTPFSPPTTDVVVSDVDRAISWCRATLSSI
ncbi:hypothetical protein BN903_23 [Halorubrum sp. AJ67]|nr:hypothetical protein BN903_23 [Halorubrum sp. AJ67]